MCKRGKNYNIWSVGYIQYFVLAVRLFRKVNEIQVLFSADLIANIIMLLIMS